MRRPGGSVFESATYANDPNRQLVQNRAVADELIGTKGGKSAYGVYEGKESCFRQPGSKADHVLFGDAYVIEPVGVFFDERVQGLVAEITRQEKYARVSRR